MTVRQIAIEIECTQIGANSIPINNEINNASTTHTEAKKGEAQTRKRAIKNIVLVPYKPKPKDWESWKVKSPYATSTIASPFFK